MSSPPTLHVAVDGDDTWPGTQDRPLRTLLEARDRVRQGKRERDGPITVLLHSGTHELTETLELSSADSGTESAPVTYLAAPGERVTISGGRRLDCRWQPYRDGIMQCHLPASQRELDFGQLFVNGERQTRARYPNRDDSDPKAHFGHILAAGKISDDIPDPHPGPNDDMLFSGGAPRGMLTIR